MRPPVAHEPYSGEYNATAFGAPCIFQNITNVSPDSIAPGAAETWQANVGVAASILVGDSEDCDSILYSIGSTLHILTHAYA